MMVDTLHLIIPIVFLLVTIEVGPENEFYMHSRSDVKVRWLSGN